MTDLQTIPRFNDIIRPTSTSLNDLPDVEYPYFVADKKGTLMHRRLGDLGRGVLRVYGDQSYMKFYPEVNIGFAFTADPVPAHICASIYQFFRRIFETKGSEAEVILTMHRETKEWRVFVPTQLASHGGVQSVYDPAVISPGWAVVGTMHSHCDFSAFHSGTDTADADNMDGLHITIGHVNRSEGPSLAAMVAMNKQKYNFSQDGIAIAADFSDLTAATAPEWWDRYVGNEQNKPVGYDLFARFNRPTTITTHISQNNVATFPKNNGTTKHQHNRQVQRWTPPTNSPTQHYDINHLLMDDREWDEYLDAKYGPTGSRLASMTSNTKPKTLTDLPFYEETLPKHQLDAIFKGMSFTDEDMELALDNVEASIYSNWWRTLLLNKLNDVVKDLKGFGVDLSYTLKVDTSQDYSFIDHATTSPASEDNLPL